MKKLSLICAILLLSACGSGKSSYEAPPGGGGGVTPAPPPAAMVDAFFTLVTQFFNPTSEDTDATPLADSISPSQPEDTEPVELT